MKLSTCLVCRDFPCENINQDAYTVPDVSVNPEDVRMVMISEVATEDASDYYYPNPANWLVGQAIEEKEKANS